MKYITKKGLSEIRQAVEQACTDVADTVELPTLSMLALLQGLDLYLNYDFDTVHEAGRRLGEILVRDGTRTAVDVGAEDYIVRAVIEALLGGEAEEPKSS